ncbi:MAG TPA: septum formation initiator family protein [Candidatus Deferrimicrobium sp.]|nr:septum formation initiator family protein [Candidatus Deferrimicrobium sp.]
MSKGDFIKEKGHFFKPKGILLLIALITFILVLTFLFGDSGILEIIKSRKQIEELKENINRLEKEKEKLKAEIEELKNNPMALEKRAREELWLMKKNEKVVVIVRENNKKNEKVKGQPAVSEEKK